jgi:hypothetical protein
VANRTVTSRFVLKGDNQSARAFASAQKQLGDLGKKVALYGSAVVAAGALIVRSNAEQIDALAKTADAYRISTESLQALRHVSELSGIAASDFDKKLGKLQKNLGEIARRGGTMAEALTDAGLSIEDVIALPLDEQLLAVSGALAKMENQTIRSSIAADLFGRDAAKMLKVTDELAAKGLAGVTAELESLGFLISRSEAAGVERMNDSMLTASRVGQGLAQQLTVALAPAIAAIAEGFTDAAKESGGFKDESVDIADGVVSALGFVLDVTDSVGRAFKLAANAGIIGFESLKGTVWGVADAIINGPNRALDGLLEKVDAFPGIDIDFRFGELAPGLRDDLNISAGIIAEARAEIDEILLAPLPSAALEQRLAKVRAELAKAAAEGAAAGAETGAGPTLISPEEEKRLDTIKASLAGLMDQVRAFGADEHDRALLKLVDLGASEAELAQAQHLVAELRLLDDEEAARKQAAEDRLDLEREYAGLVASTRTPLEQHVESMQRVAELYSQGVIPNAEAYADVLTRLSGKYDESIKKVGELDEFGKQAARNLQTHFADFLFDPFDDGIKGMLQGFSETIRRMAAEATAASIFKKLFGEGEGDAGWLGSIFKGLGGSGGGAGGGGGGWAGVVSGLAGLFGGRAVGGPVMAGTPYVLGERGPELFVPDRPGRVMPNHELTRSSGPTTYVTNINMPRESNRRTAEQQGYQLARELQIRQRRNG